MLNQNYIVAGAAINTTPLHWSVNARNIKQAIHIAGEQGARLLCLPELCISGYGCEDMFHAAWVRQRALNVLLDEVLPLVNNMAVALGLPLHVNGKVYNAVALLENNDIVGFYAKQFLAKSGVYYEPRWFEPWPAGFEDEIKINNNLYKISNQPFQLADGTTVGFEICEDAWQEDSRPLMNFKTLPDVVLNPSASHFEFGKTVQRRNIVNKGSKATGGIYVYTNLLGNESGRIIFDGEILISRNGQLLAANTLFSFKDVKVVAVPVHAPPIEHEAYVDGKNEEFRKAAALGLFDYMRKSKSKGFTLSLSGGADSATCAVLISEMVKMGVEELGVPAFIEKCGFPMAHEELMRSMLACAYQSTTHSSTATKNAAEAIAKEIGADFYHWSVDELVELSKSTFTQATEYSLSWHTDDLLLQNIQSRCRVPIIWMLANKRQSLLITTGNRSEASVGYCTMDGDTAGGLAPIAGVDKHFIRQWLLYAEHSLGYRSLALVNKLAPTAELRPAEYHQTDEADLMPYAVLQYIEHLAVRHKLKPEEVVKAVAEAHSMDMQQAEKYVERFFRMWAASQWKRERFAVGFHLDAYSVDSRGWCRFPVLNQVMYDSGRC